MTSKTQWEKRVMERLDALENHLKARAEEVTTCTLRTWASS